MAIVRRIQPIATFGSPISDIELWRCARLQQAQHGADAMAAAARRMAELEAKKDRAGYATWAGILLRIALLGPATGDDTATCH